MAKMVDMRKTSEQKAEEMMPCSPGAISEYPCGLCICLDDATLEKLSVDHDDWAVGDIFDLRGMARVTSVSENETESGKRKRVELQFVMLGAESEDAEDSED